MAWTRIVRSGKPRVKGINSQYSGLLDVEVDLKPAPPREWAAFFSQPFAVPTSLSMHPPKLSGSTVMLMPPDNELDKYVANVDARITAANDYFEQQALPSLKAAEANATRDKAAAQARIDDAERKAEGLSAGKTAQMTYASEARAANGRGHHMEGSALDERTAFGRCRDCGTELVVSNGSEVTTRPEGNCTGPAR